MRLRTQVAGLVGIGALATAVNLVLTIGVVVGNMRVGDAEKMRDLVNERWEACADAPETWTVARRGFAAYAYDPVTRTSMNPDAPPYPEQASLLRPLNYSESKGEGPCGEVKVFSEYRPELPFPFGLFCAVLFPAALSVGFAAFVARRLVGRVESMVDATRNLGEPVPLPLGPLEGPDELDSLAAALRKAHHRIQSDADALRARQQATERHLWAVAHDLRTPLAHLQLLLEGLDDGDSVRAARRELSYLVALTDNLHQQARMDGGLSPLQAGQRFDLRETVLRLSGRFTVLARLDGVALSGAVPDDALWVEGDEDLAERALGNLLHNAIRHGATQVGFTLDTASDGFRFQVIDDGPGLPDPVADALRSGAPLPRTAARTRGQGGLGLPIVREVVERHGWALEVPPAEEGACFVVSGPSAGP